MEQDINDFMIKLHDGLNYSKNFTLYNLQINLITTKVGFISYMLFAIRLQVLPNYFHWHRNCKRKIWKYRQKPSDLKETIFLSSNFRFMQKSYKLQEIIKLTTLFVKLFAVK